MARFATTVVTALRGKRVEDVLQTDTIQLSVRRGDVEATRMNNGRYLTMMDLGRYSLMLRAGYFQTLLKRRWYPLVTGVLVRFKRSLRVGTRYDLSTRVVCWNERSFFLEQWFEQRGEVCAHAFVKSLFRGPKGSLTTTELLEAGGFLAPSPAFPESIRGWELADAAAFSGIRAGGRVETAMPG